MRALIVIALLGGCGSNDGGGEPATPPPDPAPVPEPAAGEEAQTPPPATPPATPPAGDRPAPPPYDLAPWQTVVSTYATDDGGFRYAALHDNAEHMQALDTFVATVGSAQPDAWSRENQLAFYINAYNALTVNAVVDRFPIASVMRVRGFFDRITHRVAGQDLTLNQLEGDIIRARFRDPRIHFVVNCAAASCPPLLRGTYSAENLEGLLEAQTRTFLVGSTTLDRERHRATVTKLFEWYRDDWGGVDGVRAFLAERLPEADATFVRDAGTRLVYAEYDWDLNDRE